MKLERIRLINFLSHEDTELDLSNVTLLTIGGENGSGKSSIFDSLVWCLYGKISSRGSKSDAIARTGTEETSVIVDWSIGEINYSLSRTRNNKKGTQKLELYVNGELISERKKTEVEELLSNILKIPADLYALTNGLQQDGKSFLDLKPLERKSYLSEILQLDKYQKIQKEAKAAKSRLNLEKTELTGQLKALEDNTNAYQDKISKKDELESEAATLQEKLKKVVDFIEKTQASKVEEQQRQALEYSKLETKIEVKEKDLKALKQNLEDLQSNELPKDPSAEVEELIRNLEKIKDKSSELDDVFTENKAKLSAIANEYKKIQELTEKTTNIETNVPCPTCQQVVPEEHIENIKKMYQEQAEKLKETGNSLKKTIEKLTTEKESYKEEIKTTNDRVYNLKLQAQKAAQLLEKIEQTKVKISTLQEEISTLKETLETSKVEEVPVELLEKIKKAEIMKSGLSNEINKVLKETQQIKFYEEECQKNKEKCENLQKKIGKLDSQIETYNLIVDACHPQKGIPAKIIENSLYPLEKIANDLLDSFPGPYKFNVYFKTLTDEGKETLELMVRSSNSAEEKIYEQHSGGEKMRISLALRIALIRMISSLYCAENRTLIIDEGFHSLSVDIRQAVYEILSQLQGVWFDKILTISHSPEIADVSPYRLELKKDSVKNKTVINYKNF